MSVYRSNEKWFSMPFGGMCGLFIKDRAARKLQKLLWRQTQEIKDFLVAHKDDCLTYNWTLAYPMPDKKQTTVHYTDESETVEERLKWIDKTDRLTYVPDLFVSDKQWNEASEEVRAFYEKMYGDENDDAEIC